jgi:hypothetical protein
LKKPEHVEEVIEMAIGTASIKKRLEALENALNENDALKIFMYNSEAEVPFWEPEDPAKWQKLHPKGKAVRLVMTDCGIDDREN